MPSVIWSEMGTEAQHNDVVLLARNLSKSYRSGKMDLEVLRGVGLQIFRGETVAITGASGVGKSTLLHILGTLDRPTSGDLEIQSVDVLNLGEEELAGFRNRHIGFVFQFHNLLPEFTALENVMMPGLIADESASALGEEAGFLLDRVGLGARLHHRPGEMSGGECQRVAVARALIRKPQVVLADEPSGNLDDRASRSLHELIRELAAEEQETFIVMTHDREFAASLDRTGHIEAGVLHLN
ncbi:MAG: ABC transporter ATP-binding protein [Candidatus Latescibacterota bacterium]|nr:ABC transporter ATP-binding protein [Candidatus Latescibacterota bacterium]